MNIQSLINLSLLLVITTVLISCEEDEFFEKEYLQEVEDNYNEENQGEEETIDNIIEEASYNCEVAEYENALKTHIITVSFPAAIECNFLGNNEDGVNGTDVNAAGNGRRVQAVVKARNEQSFKAELPANSTVCDMNFDFPNQMMEYDDEIFLLMNDYVLMSSQNYSEATTAYSTGLKVNDLGFQEYKWMGENGLYDLFYGWDVTPKYCLGVDSDDPDIGTKCNIPRTETVGEMKLDIPKDQIVKLGILSRNFTNPDLATEFDFGFVTTGDNDAGDCEHAAYSFNVTVQYIDK
jgi:hypothetical protein